jgi:pimeloyl-ACP methyl ester carboxylesterase
MSQQVELRLSSGEVLRGDLNPGTRRTDFAIVYVHGFGSNRGGEKAAALAAECARRGLTFAAFDFRGHGQSDGQMRALTASQLLEDLAAISSHLASCGYRWLGLVGSSMGGFAAAWFTTRRLEAVVGCVLIAPAFRFLQRRWEELNDAERADWKLTGVRRVHNEWIDVEIGYGLVLERNDFDPAVLARNWKTPTLIVHGLFDEIVPPSDSLTFVRETPFADVELRLLHTNDHRLTAYKDEIAAEACRFLERWI